MEKETLCKQTDIINTSKCTGCKKTFPLTADFFYRNNHPNYSARNGFAYYCKKCSESAKRKSYNPKRARKDSIKWLYGMLETDYNKLLIKQRGVCAICGGFNNNQRSKNLVIDHCHKTKKIRGLLCHKCNVALGHFNDNVDLIRKALGYMEKHTCQTDNIIEQV